MSFLLKWLLVSVLVATGIVSLLTGLGLEVAALKYQGFEGQGVPAGVVLLIAAIALAALWRVSSTTSTREIKPDGTIRERIAKRKGMSSSLRAALRERLQNGSNKDSTTE